MEALLALAVFLGLILCQAAVLRRFGLRRLTYRRAFSAKAAFEGETVEYIEEIQNMKPLFLPWLKLQSKIPSSLEFLTRDGLEIRGRQYHMSVFTMSPYSRITRRFRVRLAKRGHYRLDSCAATLGGLWGIAAESQDVGAPASLSVYPRLLGYGAAGLPSSRWQGDWLVRRWIVNDPFLSSGVRPYADGDQVRDINWPATARMGSLQVKVYDQTADPRLYILLNCQKTENQWSDLMDYEQGIIEYGISLAATLCLEALDRGIEAGFAANMPLDGGTECAVLPPRRHASRAEELLEAFARLRVVRVRNFPTFLDDLGTLSNMDILILSAYDSGAIRERMEDFRLAGNTVALRLLEAEREAS